MLTLIELAETRKQALAILNVIRTTLNKEPLDHMPKGYRKSIANCPAAVALDILDGVFYVTYHWISFPNSEIAKTVADALGVKVGPQLCDISIKDFEETKALSEFIIHFDMGRYSDLEGKEGEANPPLLPNEIE